MMLSVDFINKSGDFREALLQRVNLVMGKRKNPFNTHHALIPEIVQQRIDLIGFTSLLNTTYLAIVRAAFVAYRPYFNLIILLISVIPSILICKKYVPVESEFISNSVLFFMVRTSSPKML